ncbi:MAG: aspartate racemase family [Chloroflexi bacterium]|nr:aspartate racemase family [Chloroflexota bacterium]
MVEIKAEPDGSGRTVGVLGGMGPAATIDFYRRIVDSTYALRDQDHLHVLIDSRPSVPDRTAFLLGCGNDPRPMLIDMAQRLERAGADLLVMACNTANAFIHDIAASVHVPVLHWIDEAVAGTFASEPAIRKVGLLATDGTLASGLYARAFERYGVDVIVPGPSSQRRVMAAIYGPTGVKSGYQDLRSARNDVELSGQETIDGGADVVLLACTELSLLFAEQPPRWRLKTIDAAQVVARSIVARAGGRLDDRNADR